MKVPKLPLGQSVIHISGSGFINPSTCVTQSLATAKPTKGLTTEEVAVIKSYTSSCRLYEMLNAALRTEQQVNIQPWFAYLKLFQMAIVKIPAKYGSYCRGITGDYHNMYKVGSTVVWVRILIGNSSLNFFWKKAFLKKVNDLYGMNSEN
ncbi:unnamed protein product [Rotaria magnacalcarata]|uniref:Uncharacterized protein n=1 Tax=Rotaria magnacalcarata TaxID=392030 RepID=A0A816SVD1_9BILA|nr:unnamed protein product [Rotaria magnacalcarata]